jgi:hypothetical protein
MLLADFNWIDFSPEQRFWWTAVGIGAVLLLLAVLVLARLRWIQRRPFATCVVLSVFAHVLLIACICLTRIFDAPPPLPGSETIYVTLSDGDEFVVEEPEPEELLTEPLWSEPLWSEGEQAEEMPPELVDELVVPDNLDIPDLVDEPTPEQVAEERIHDPLPEMNAPDLIAPPAPVETVGPEPDQLAAELAKPDDPPPIEQPQPTTTPEPIEPMRPDEFPAQEIAKIDDVMPESESFPVEEPPESTDPIAEEVAELIAGPVDRLVPVGPAPSEPVEKRESAPIERSVADDSEWLPHREPEPIVLDNGHVVPQRYRLRGADDRLEAARRLGGSVESEAAVEAALAWLAGNQSPDGRWDASTTGAGRVGSGDGRGRGRAGLQADNGITGLALLAMLSAGHTHQQGAYKSAVSEALNFLLRSQAPEGHLGGAAGNYARMYCHGIATLAVSEALAMSGDRRLQPYLGQAVDYTLRSQDPHAGGWRYHPGQAGDLSQFGWQLMALSSAEQAGIEIPSRQRMLMDRFLQSTLSDGGALASYRPGESPSVSMTAEAMACRAFLGHPLHSSPMDQAARYVMQSRPGSGPNNFYFWYYASLALSQRNDGDWRRWNNSLQATLLPLQRNDSNLAGSWDPNTVWGGHGGRIYSTAMATLCLEVYYRYLPIYERTAGK